MGTTQTKETTFGRSASSRGCGSGSTGAHRDTRISMLQSCGGCAATRNIPTDRPLLAASRQTRVLCGQIRERYVLRGELIRFIREYLQRPVIERPGL